MDGFLNPASVALIGVPRQSGVGAYNNLEMMLRYGYQGKIHVIHPKVPNILGFPTFPSVEALPEVPELAVISVGRDRVLPVFKQCAQKGIRNVIVISQGFADADEAGAELQRELVETARRFRVRVLGPNTMGVLNAFSHFSTAFLDLPKDPSPPPLSLVAQSGVLQVGIESFTGRIGKAIDIGNGCDVHFADVLPYLERDPQTEIIVLHMEGIQRGREFLRAAARMAGRKPIIVFKTGRSKAGAKAALSHTGSLVGEDAVFDAAFRKAGLVRVRNMVELRAACKAFLNFRPMEGPALGVATATGACGIMTADACEDQGLQPAPFPESARSALENPRIAWHRLGNPVDLWPLGMVGGSFTEVLEKTCNALFESDHVHGILVIAPVMASSLHDNLHLPETTRRIQERNTGKKPLAFWLYGDGAQDEAPRLDAMEGVACFASIDEAVLGLSATYRYRQIQQNPPRVEMLEERSEPGAARLEAPEGIVTGTEAEKILRSYGIASAPGLVTRDASQAAQWAESVGYPVVLKILSPQWLHKSDRGGVVTGITDRSSLERAFSDLLERFRQTSPDDCLVGIQVQKQLSGKELLLGISRDPQFGPVVLVGMGGIYTEVFRDVARGIAPLEREEADRLLRSLRIYPLLQGVRSEAPVDLSAVTETLLALSRLAMDHPEIAELDLNPVFANDQGCFAVDCRVVLSSG
ncbi:acetyltransferase [Desulfacinum hydrothermale DSM 13146]|uniref:Acetyltransferase n=1 Tax=Desulfacinum hydrothermale DSM 13146 TaxID=1121390 RepID=A0A1W1X2X9_9BACT|nr:acetate--CoA ligase family protein [Desulfacinum hydrothermale]SMC17761.1 acetyltransferase [Desulfacinum hydrothermale DSM 13146]